MPVERTPRDSAVLRRLAKAEEERDRYKAALARVVKLLPIFRRDRMVPGGYRHVSLGTIEDVLRQARKELRAR
jgi:hypothetical protein